MHAVVHALAITGSMTWEIAWALIGGFALSAVIQAVVRRSTVVRLLGDARPRTLLAAVGLGAASSSCSYAAVALARALFRKGADFTAAMAFEIASTNQPRTERGCGDARAQLAVLVPFLSVRCAGNR